MNLSERSSSRAVQTALLSVSILLSLLWLTYQILIWNSCASYLGFSREILEYLRLPQLNKDTEWRRFCSNLAYLQTLPHVLLAYCLLTKWPGKGRKAPRAVLIVVCFLISLLAIPRIAGKLFPSYLSIFSPNNDHYFMVLMVHGLLGCIGVLAVFLIITLSPLIWRNHSVFQPRAIGRAFGRYGLTIAVALLIAVAYGFILGILNHFNESAVNYVLRSFGPDAKLISGIICMCLLAPLIEEMAFRGVILTSVKRHANVWFAVIFSSLLFGLWHRNLGQFFPTTVMGIIFSWVYLRTGKLRYAMLTHSLSNFLLALAQSSGDGYLPKVQILYDAKNLLLDVSLIGGIIGLLIIVALIVWVFWKGYPRFTEEK